MKITLAMISKKLSEKYPDLNIVINNNMTDRSFDGIRLLPDQKTGLNTSYIYFCQDDHVILQETIPPDLTLICLTQKPECFKQLPIVLLTTNEEPAVIFNSLQEIHISFKNWDRDMHTTLISQQDLQYMADISEPILDVPFLIYDPSLKLLANSKNHIPEDDVFQSASSEGFMTSKSLAIFEENSFIETLKTQDWFIGSRENVNHISYIHKILSDKHMNGYCVFLLKDDHDLNYYQDMMQNFLENVQLLLGKENYMHLGQNYIYEYLFADLMKETNLNEESIKERLSYIGLPFSHTFYLIELRYDEAKQMSIDFFLRSMSNLIENSYVYQYNGHLLILTYTERLHPYTYRNNFQTQFLDFTYETQLHNMRCGISQPFFEITKLKNAQRQTSFALTISEKIADTTNELWLEPPVSRYPYAFYEDYKLYDFCLTKLIQSSPESVIDYRVMQLSKSDIEKQTNYIRILSTYLKCNQQKSLTAEKLHMHRNNIVYHLNRIESLFHIHFEQSEELVSLYYSFICLDLQLLFDQA